MRRALAAFSISVKERLSYRADVLAMAGFLVVLVLIFSRLWIAVGEGGGGVGRYRTSSLVLYLVIAELVILAPANAHQRVAAEVKSGDLAVHLLRPVGYVWWELAREAGTAAVRLVALAATGAPAALLLGGVTDIHPLGLAVGLGVLVPLAILVEISARLSVGLLSLWLEDATPLYWIWQKAAFVLGGLMLPIDLYPQWLQRIIAWLPFQALLYGPARTVVAYDPAFARHALGSLLVWAAVMLVVLHTIYAASRRRLQVNGG